MNVWRKSVLERKREGGPENGMCLVFFKVPALEKNICFLQIQDSTGGLGPRYEKDSR